MASGASTHAIPIFIGFPFWKSLILFGHSLKFFQLAIFLMRGFAPADEALLFRQKDPKPFLRVRGPSASTPNKMARELAPLKQLSPKSRFGTPAPPRPTQEKGNIGNFNSAQLSTKDLTPNLF